MNVTMIMKAKSMMALKELEKALPGKPAEDKPLERGAHRTPPKGYPKKRSEYADPKEFKYPINSPEHIHAAISYFSKPKNAGEYSGVQQRAIWRRIKAAAKKHKIEVAKTTGE